MEDVANDQCHVPIFTKTNNETSGDVEYSICSRRLPLQMYHREHSVAIVNPISDKRSSECLPCITPDTSLLSDLVKIAVNHVCYVRFHYSVCCQG